MNYPTVQPHDLPVQIADDLFVVYGSVRMMPVMRITRNMAIIRHAGELTLVNAVRMDEQGLQALDKLGQVEHVIRLGPLHGMDDAFYVDRYDAALWSFEDGVTYTTPTPAHTLVDGGELPVADARLFAFDHLTETEGVILLERGPGILLTVDAVQSYATPPHMPHTGWLARQLLPLAGFPNKTIVGPVWVKRMATDREGLAQEFQRLLAWDFDQLLSAHGTFLPRGAHADLSKACNTMFNI